jgi:hypothetical protein
MPRTWTSGGALGSKLVPGGTSCSGSMWYAAAPSLKTALASWLPPLPAASSLLLLLLPLPSAAEAPSSAAPPAAALLQGLGLLAMPPPLAPSLPLSPLIGRTTADSTLKVLLPPPAAVCRRDVGTGNLHDWQCKRLITSKMPLVLQRCYEHKAVDGLRAALHQESAPPHVNGMVLGVVHLRH